MKVLLNIYKFVHCQIRMAVNTCTTVNRRFYRCCRVRYSSYSRGSPRKESL